MTWLLHVLGVDDASGRWYLFWSGAGADLGYMAIFGGFWHKHNCHQARCWRLSRHVVDGTPWCNKHHEEVRR